MPTSQRKEVQVWRLLARLRDYWGEQRIFLVLAVFAGGLAGFFAVLYHILLESIFSYYRMSVSFRHPDWKVVAFPVVGGLIAALILRLLPMARGSGVAHTKIAIVARDGFISVRSTLGKFLASAIGIGTGQSMGPEGPAIHIGAGVASLVGRTASLSKEKVQQLVPIGAAAGLAAVFNAPISAVLFVLEEVVGDLNTPLLGSTIVAAVVAVIVSGYFLGNEPLFQVPAYRYAGGSELFIFALLGIVAGLYSVAFTGGLAWSRERLKRLAPAWTFWLPVAGATSVGVMAIFFPQVLSVGYSWVNDVLNNGMTLQLVLWLALFKLVATLLCYATGNVGGIFAPSLYMGAMVGGAAGGIAHLLFPTSQLSSVGAYALIGMGAVFAGINRTPMTSIFMIFEVTRDYNLILPLMIANITAYTVARRLQHVGIYEVLAAQDGITLPSHQTEHVLRRLTNRDALPENYLALPTDATVEEAMALIERAQGITPASAFPVTLDDHLHGVVTQAALTRAMAENRGHIPVGGLAESDPDAVVFPDESLDSSLFRLGQGQSILVVVSRLDTSHILGVLTSADIMHAFGIATSQRAEEVLPATAEGPRG